MFPFRGPQEVHIAFADAAQDAQAVVAIGAVDVLVLAADFKADEIVARDEVADAAGPAGCIN